jgi:cation diffusion facilitator CzcD-associated flavoprotein CzcO
MEVSGRGQVMSEHFRIAIIGAGFGGLGMAIQLRRHGERDLVVLEKQADLGGCWHDNTYPGAACDVPSHLYSFSFEPCYDWAHRFARQHEIQAYLEHCADKYDVRRHIRFDTEVSAADFDEPRGCWHLRQADGRTLTATVVITATGQLNRPAMPSIPGLEDFRGHWFHSARWDHDFDPCGKDVAIVGTGASAVQFLPPVARQARRLYLFQRSAPYVVPRPDKTWKPWQRRLMQRFPALQKLDRGRIYVQLEARVPGFTFLQFLLKVYQWRFQRLLHKQVRNPELRRKLRPDYPLGCKRVLLANDYYPALDQDHVEVINAGIDRVSGDLVRAADGSERKVEAIIFGTGFQATDFLSPITITGRDGRSLNQAWQDGAEAYLGMTVHGFPNLFMLYGPNTNLGHSSVIYMLESQIHYILQCLDLIKTRKLRYLEVRAEPQYAFNRKIQRKMEHTVWQKGCDSWYKTADGRNTNNWPGFTFMYRRRTRHVQLADYHRVGETG